jgi:hypothetical protein
MISEQDWKKILVRDRRNFGSERVYEGARGPPRRLARQRNFFPI